MQIMIVMVQTDPGPVHRRQSQILVPHDTPGVEIRGAMHVFGEDDAPHGHMHIRFNNVRVPASNMLWGEGKGLKFHSFVSDQAVFTTARSVGAAEKARAHGEAWHHRSIRAHRQPRQEPRGHREGSYRD